MELSYIPSNIYQFRIVVQRIRPLIWRRFSIRSAMSLATLQTTLPIVFGWSDVHLPTCRIHGKEDSCARLGGPHFKDDPRHVPHGQLRLHRA